MRYQCPLVENYFVNTLSLAWQQCPSQHVPGLRREAIKFNSSGAKKKNEMRS